MFIDEDIDPAEIQQRRAQLFNEQQLEMSALEKRQADEKKSTQKNALADWELKYAQAKLELKEKHYKVRKTATNFPKFSVYQQQ